MTNPQQQQPAEVIRNFTAARKFPQLIGKTPDGKRIAGGPYTLTQFVGGAGALVGLYLTRGVWWSQLGMQWSIVLVVTVVVGTVVLLGRIRPGGRSPLSVAAGAARALSAEAETRTTADRASLSPTAAIRRKRGRPHVVPAAAYIWPTPPTPHPHTTTR